jgi:carbonic anhydrase
MPRLHTRVRFAAATAVTAVLTLTLTGATGATGAEPHWSYDGKTGPEYWAGLDPEYALCADATRQSPIDIGHPSGTRLPSLRYRFTEGKAVVSNNGHTVLAAANAADPTKTSRGNSIVVSGKRYDLLQMHYHVSSEHVVQGRHYPAEAHFVYRSESGALSVLGVFLERGHKTNWAWQPFIAALRTPEDKTKRITLDWGGMLPQRRTTVRYEGSLTTPPCSEGVTWTVETTPVRVSQAQLEALAAVYDHNYRPAQPVGTRAVLTDDHKLADD